MMGRRAMRMAPLVLALSCGIAQAGMFDGDAMGAVEKLREEHGTRLDNLDQAARNQLALANQVETLKSDLAGVRGQVEVLTFELAQAQKRLQDYYLDLDNRLRKFETAQEAAKKAEPDPAVQTQEFEAALTLFKNAQYKEATDAFLAFINRYPTGQFTPAAHYWAGNGYFQQKDWPRAGGMYRQLADKWPNDEKAPEALLQLAETQKQSGARKDATTTLQEIITKYPDSPAAATAKKQKGR